MQPDNTPLTETREPRQARPVQDFPPVALAVPPSGAAGPSGVEGARAHLRAAIAQSLPTDDQINLDHVKTALRLLCGRAS